MTLASGAKLGPYEILGQIGAGGMGEVYRAKDPRLGRDVAIKVLPASFSADAERLRRFEQEAKAAGVLNHPNITAVYDIGSHDESPYVVQELLEGETLRSVLAGGKLSPRRAIDYGLQIANGLAAAHEKGIVHRDLKPENLFVTRDGRVKILDFGLAKLTHQEEGSQVTNLPTATAGTEPGVVLGTLGYMSPEQVRGRSADARSDIFSFGAILYEMLSGNRAFRGDSAADTMSAILREDPPDLSVTNQNVSPGLERIVRHCLEKSPEQRFHSAHDLAFDLEAQSTSSGAPSTIGRIKARRGPLVRAPLLLAAAAAALGIVLGHSLWKPPKPSTPTYRRLTFRRGNVGTARFTPDGGAVVYSASWEGQPLEIFVTRSEGPESTPIGIKNANLFSVSASGELAISLRERFLAGPSGPGTLATVPIGGGAPRPIAEFVEGANWTPDGKQLAVMRFVEGKNRLELPLGKVLYAPERGFKARISPRGDRFAILQNTATGPSLVLLDLTGKSSILLEGPIRGQGMAWDPSAREIWFDDIGEHGQFLLKAVDLSGRERVVDRAPVGLLIHDISRDGRVLIERYGGQPGILALSPGSATERELSWFDRSEIAGLSDDGSTILINETGDATNGSTAFYLRRTDGSPAVKLGQGIGLELSPDGKWVLTRAADSDRALTLVPTGTGTPVPIELGAFEHVRSARLFPDGKRILLNASEPGKPLRWYVQELPSGKPRAIADRRFGLPYQPISPDGQWIVAYGDYSDDLFLVPVAGGKLRSLPNTKDLEPARWAPDGKSFFAWAFGSIPSQVFRVDAETGRREPWKELAPVERSGLIAIRPVFVTPDGKSYAYGYDRSATSDLYVIEGLK
jgi:serine/threonine protein kinase/Tol biopolymer transport system component